MSIQQREEPPSQDTQTLLSLNARCLHHVARLAGPTSRAVCRQLHHAYGPLDGSLHLCDMDSASELISAINLSCFRTIKRLKLHVPYDLVSDETLLAISKACRSLQSLELASSFMNVTSHGIASLHHLSPTLQHLDLCRLFDVESFIPGYISQMSMLRSLQLPVSLVQNGWLAKDLRQLSQLTELRLSSTALGEKVVRAVAKLSRLVHLEIPCFCMASNPSAVTVLSRLQALTHLATSGLPMEATHIKAWAAAVSPLRQLQHLTASVVNTLKDVPKLRIMDDIIQVAVQLPLLTCLDLGLDGHEGQGEGTMLTAAGMQQLHTAASCLRALTLNCELPAGWSGHIAQCTSLTRLFVDAELHLNLEHMPQLTQLSNLEELKVVDDALGPYTISHWQWLASLTQLKVLQLFTPAFRDEHVPLLAPLLQLEKLKLAHVEDVNVITPVALQTLRKLPGLKSLMVYLLVQSPHDVSQHFLPPPSRLEECKLCVQSSNGAVEDAVKVIEQDLKGMYPAVNWTVQVYG